MQQIKNIIFDFGNVLMDLDLPAIERHFQKCWGDQADAARARLVEHRVFDLYEKGGLSTEEFVEAVRFAATPVLTEAQVLEAWNSIFIGMPGHRFDFLLQLRKQYKVFLLSNINALHERWIADYMLREHRISDYEIRFFDGVYFSHLIRLRKPDRVIYEYLLEDAELHPDETIFFDDLEINVEAARHTGIHAFLHPIGTEIASHVQRILPEHRLHHG